MPGYSAVLWTAWLRSSGSQRCGPLDRKASKHAKLDAKHKTMKNVKHQNFENLKTYISYNNLFKLIEVMEHSCFQGKHNFHNFDKFTYMCYNCYNYHNLLITSASTNCQYSRHVCILEVVLVSTHALWDDSSIAEHHRARRREVHMQSSQRAKGVLREETYGLGK